MSRYAISAIAAVQVVFGSNQPAWTASNVGPVPVVVAPYTPPTAGGPQAVTLQPGAQYVMSGGPGRGWWALAPQASDSAPGVLEMIAGSDAPSAGTPGSTTATAASSTTLATATVPVQPAGGGIGAGRWSGQQGVTTSGYDVVGVDLLADGTTAASTPGFVTTVTASWFDSSGNAVGYDVFQLPFLGGQANGPASGDTGVYAELPVRGAQLQLRGFTRGASGSVTYRVRSVISDSKRVRIGCGTGDGFDAGTQAIQTRQGLRTPTDVLVQMGAAAGTLPYLLTETYTGQVRVDLNAQAAGTLTVGPLWDVSTDQASAVGSQVIPYPAGPSSISTTFGQGVTFLSLSSTSSIVVTAQEPRS